MLLKEFKNKYQGVKVSYDNKYNELKITRNHYKLVIYNNKWNTNGKIGLTILKYDNNETIFKDFINDCFKLFENENNYSKYPIFIPLVEWNARYETRDVDNDLEIKFYNIHKTNLEIKFLIKDIKEFKLDEFHIYYKINQEIRHWDLEKFLKIIKHTKNWKFRTVWKNE